MYLKEILEQAIEQEASDVFLVAGLPVSFRKQGVITRLNDTKLLPNDTEALLTEIYSQAGNRLSLIHILLPCTSYLQITSFTGSLPQIRISGCCVSYYGQRAASLSSLFSLTLLYILRSRKITRNWTCLLYTSRCV